MSARDAGIIYGMMKMQTIVFTGFPMTMAAGKTAK
jgi:hypothetical protein